jgi:hypothetical protein
MSITDIFRKITTITTGSIVLLSLFLAGCSSLKKVSNKAIFPESVSLHVGGSQGGFIEESGMDAISGATNTSGYDKEDSGMNFYAGFHWQYRVNKSGGLETGVDFISHQQCLIYHDPSLGFEGKLDLDYNRLCLPVTYNFGFIKNKHNNPSVNVKTGFSLNYIHSKQTKITGVIPEFSLKKFAVAPYFNVSVIPIDFNRYALGVFFSTSLLKGTKVFHDNIYHNNYKTGLLSTMELGCCVKIKL